MNKHTPILLGSLLALLTVMPVNAQVTMDVSKITCEQFLLWKVANPDKIAIWLSGYFNGKRGNTVIDIKQLEEYASKLTGHCRANYNMTVLHAAEAVIAANK